MAQTAVPSGDPALERIVVPPDELSPQIRVGDKPTRQNFEPIEGVGGVLSSTGLWTTTLRRHGPLWHLHMPKFTDTQQWWKVEPADSARIARISHPQDIETLLSSSQQDLRSPYRFPWGEISHVVDAVWLTERGHERLRRLNNSEYGEMGTLEWTKHHPSYRIRGKDQQERFLAFERWASGCVLWLRWKFETVSLYRHARPEDLYVEPFSVFQF